MNHGWKLGILSSETVILRWIIAANFFAGGKEGISRSLGEEAPTREESLCGEF